MLHAALLTEANQAVTDDTGCLHARGAAVRGADLAALAQCVHCRIPLDSKPRARVCYFLLRYLSKNLADRAAWSATGPALWAPQFCRAQRPLLITALAFAFPAFAFPADASCLWGFPETRRPIVRWRCVPSVTMITVFFCINFLLLLLPEKTKIF